ncbi:MAG: phage protein GemA/Gp16 family protein [Bacteroidales bacterium]
MGRNVKKIMITNAQVKQIHAIVHRLGLSDDLYRGFLRSNYGVTTSKLLTMIEADGAIALLGNVDNEITADYMISIKQMRYIKSLWIDIDISACEEGDKHLKSFLQNRFNVERLEQLTKRQAHGVIAAVLKMKQRQSEVKVSVNTAADGSKSVNVHTKDVPYSFNIKHNKKYNA